jgi:hypothetical protein
MKNKLILALTFLVITLSTPACFVVVYPEGEDVAPEVKMAPKPEIEMSDELVRSKRGDMIAFLPKDWFFVDMNGKLESDVFATAVNPEYNMSLVFSVLDIDDQAEKMIKKEGLVGAARLSFDARNKKSEKTLSLSGKYQMLHYGSLKFAVYNYTTTGAGMAKTAVLKSALGVYYECSLIPMSINDNPVPPASDIEKIFESVLATLKY